MYFYYYQQQLTTFVVLFNGSIRLFPLLDYILLDEGTMPNLSLFPQAHSRCLLNIWEKGIYEFYILNSVRRALEIPVYGS